MFLRDVIQPTFGPVPWVFTSSEARSLGSEFFSERASVVVLAVLRVCVGSTSPLSRSAGAGGEPRGSRAGGGLGPGRGVAESGVRGPQALAPRAWPRRPPSRGGHGRGRGRGRAPPRAGEEAGGPRGSGPAQGCGRGVGGPRGARAPRGGRAAALLNGVRRGGPLIA